MTTTTAMTTLTTLTTLSGPLADGPEPTRYISTPLPAHLAIFDKANEPGPMKHTDGTTNESSPAPTPRDSGVFFGPCNEPCEPRPNESPTSAWKANDQDPLSPPRSATAT